MLNEPLNPADHHRSGDGHQQRVDHVAREHRGQRGVVGADLELAEQGEAALDVRERVVEAAAARRTTIIWAVMSKSPPPGRRARRAVSGRGGRPGQGSGEKRSGGPDVVEAEFEGSRGVVGVRERLDRERAAALRGASRAFAVLLQRRGSLRRREGGGRQRVRLLEMETLRTRLWGRGSQRCRHSARAMSQVPFMRPRYISTKLGQRW